MKMINRACLATTLALAGIACGDDDGGDDDVDMFTPSEDMGPEVDMFEPEEDMGPEADMFVPPETVNVRIAHLIPDAPNVRVCIGPPGFPAAVDPLPSAEDLPDGVPFRAVGSYNTLPIGDVEARVFAADAIDDLRDGDCTIGSMASDPEPLLTITVNATDLVSDAYYTVAAIGFRTPGDYQCPDPDGGPSDTIDCPDTRGMSLELYEDSDVDAANALIRVLHAIPNAPNVDICYDADGDTEDPVELFENVTFGEASDYNMQDADLEGGSFRIFAHVAPGMDCPTGSGGAFELFELEIPTNTSIQAAFGPDGAGLNIVTDSYDTGSVHTIFAEGIAGVAPPAPDDPDNGFTAFVPIIDLAP
jgi:hypothetical protein